MYYIVTRAAWYSTGVPRFHSDYEDLDPIDPFEVDTQLVHLFAHEGMDLVDVEEVWADNPIFYPAREDGEADWLMVGEVTGDILLVPLAAGRRPNKARPIGVYKAGVNLAQRYREDSEAGGKP